MRKTISAVAVCLVGCVSAIALADMVPSKRTDGIDSSTIVRPLAFKPSDGAFYFQFGGQSKATVMDDAAAVETLLGKDSAKQLLDLVDFTKKKIVLVSWLTFGPPEGSLKHEVNGEGNERQIVFYVQGPVGAKARGMRERNSVNFFAVPKDIAVVFDAEERL